MINKNTARAVAKEFRKELSSDERLYKSRKIFENFVNSRIFAECNELFLFASLKDEPLTDLIAERSLNENKKIAYPKCTDNNGCMSFYYVNSHNELKEGLFGVREPINNANKLAVPNSRTVVLVPALAFNPKGFRVGYGKGYYDRYLSKFDCVSVGICYNELCDLDFSEEKYDISVNYIVNDKKLTEFYPG